jgi:carboxyl-terminal processing protease
MLPGALSRTVVNRAVLTFFVTISAFAGLHGQGLDGLGRSRAKNMLNNVKKTIKDEYYDPTYGGKDLDAHFKQAEEKLDKATSNAQATGIIAQAVIDFNDSHLMFYPPSLTITPEYGWRMQAIGDKIYVIAVKPGSDAAKQGLKPGDEIISIENYRPTRKELWKVQYYYNQISPRNGLRLQVMSPGSDEVRSLNIASKLNRSVAVQTIEDVINEIDRSGSGGYTHRFKRFGRVTIWKMPNFVLEPDDVDKVMRERVGTTGDMILDLRGNGGGYVLSLERLAGYFVEKDTKIADLKGRKTMKPQMAKTQGEKAFRGKLVVLVDSGSGSAAEIFARFIQLEHRGIVIGDQSAGAVMQSRTESMKMGTDSLVFYGMNVTNADVILSDGVSLEHKGVTPDKLILKTAADLAAERDPVLAAALKTLGVEVSPDDAGKVFPFDWKIETQ